MKPKLKTTIASDPAADMEKEKLRQDIRTLKLQYLVTVLTLFGGVVSFFILQKKEIINLFNKKPTISFVSHDEFTRSLADIQITDIKGNPVIKSVLRNLPAAVELEPGSYTMTLNLHDQKLWSDSFYLISNEKRTVELPDPFTGRIEIAVELIDPSPETGQEIKFTLTTSGNGYLWIYEIVGDQVQLRYPGSDLYGTNTVTANREFAFPANDALFAGKDVKTEQYCFLVTSVNDENYANGLMSWLYPKGIAKGEIGDIRKNWGFRRIFVRVRQGGGSK